MRAGVEWLKSRQQQDGSWDEGYRSQFPIGGTALATLALIKAGYGDDPAVEKALDYLERQEPRKTYGTGILLLLLEARYAPSREETRAGKSTYTRQARQGFRRAKRGHKRLAKSAARWLLATRHQPLWGYPMGGAESGGTRTRDRGGSSARGRGGAPGGQRGGPPGGRGQGPGGQRGGPPGGRGSGPGQGGGQRPGQPSGGRASGGNEWDHSNTQYALLGLGAAKRLGVKVSSKDLYQALEALLAGQESSGPSVESFSVPAADASWDEIETLAEDLAQARAQAAEGQSDDRVTRTRSFYSSHPPQTMQARGWGYVFSGPSNDHPAASQSHALQPGNSMTAACVASLIVLKSVLGKSRSYERKFGEAVDRAIRDGVAYLARNWTVRDQRHPYYYLYGLERVGVLSGCFELGGHDWYVEGAAQLVRDQGRDGSWGSSQAVTRMDQVNALPQTSFALLFLARGTPPLVPELPERPVTGSARQR